MKPRRVKGVFNQALIQKCQRFAEDSLDLSLDQYAKRGQDPYKRGHILKQIVNGKLAEELTFATYCPYFPDLTHPDFAVYQKKDKSWSPDLTSQAGGLTLSVKAKDQRDADRWGASWIFENTDRKTFGSKLDGRNLEPNQYVCLIVVDPVAQKGEVKACLNLQWLHDHQLFESPDRDYLGTKKTVRLKSLLEKITNQEELWQLGWETP